MTAYPDPATFGTKQVLDRKSGVFMRPKVQDHFWGYEVRPNEDFITLAYMKRIVAGLLAAFAVTAAGGVWLLAGFAFFVQVYATKAIATLLFVMMAVVFGRFAVRGTCVRLQIDTANGELREVVNSLFGADLVLAQYGFDAVETVKIVSSQTNRSFGQVQIRIRGVGSVPAGDGAITALGALQDRMKSNFGLDGASREAIWSGPRVA